MSERFIELCLEVAFDLVIMWIINHLSKQMESKFAKVLVKILLWVYFALMIIQAHLKLMEG